MRDSDRRSPNIKDRGEAKYFHGRKGILADFKERLEWAEQDPKEGTTFLIQAAPGAGKSALLHECTKLAENTGWEAVRVNIRALWDTDTMCQKLGDGWMPLLDEIAVQGGFDKWIQIQGAAKFKLPGHTPQSIIERGKAPLLLFLDEAQILGQQSGQLQEHRELVQNFLNSIHNGEMGRPVMLLTAGLSATKRAFKDLGVSRFKDNCYVELGPLKPEAERRVIKDWLKLEGRAKGDPAPWIDAIMQKTHGWPQHVAAYAQAAAFQIRTDKRAMTPQGLQEVLEVGEMKRIKFYKSRAEGLDEHHRMAIARAFVSTRQDQTQSRKAIMESLVKAVGEQEADTVFKRALKNGVLDHRDGRYVIPIPSMRRWFIVNYFIERDPPDQSLPDQDPPPDRPFDPLPGKFSLGHFHDSDRDLER